MKKFTEEEYIKRVQEIEKVLFESLDLKNSISDIKLTEFFTTMIAYLEHSSSDSLAGRTPETLKNNIDNFLKFCKKIGLTNEMVVEIIIKFPSIIHSSSDIEEKYILLSLIENENNTLRKTKLIEKPRDYIVDIETLYARYSLANSLNYKLTWNSLVKNSEKEFASIFTKNGYYKPYKIFKTLDECSTDELIKMFPIDYNFIEELRTNELNDFGVIDEKRHDNK